MKKIALVALFAVCLVGLSFAQGLNVEKVAGSKTISQDVFGNTVAQSRYGTQIVNNLAVQAWWSGVSTDYINLDWGLIGLNDTNGLFDEVIDGFAFVYGTNNEDVTGEDFDVYFFDSCTGTGYAGVQEAGFAFTGLPNAATYGSLPAGYGWTVTLTVDIEGTGYEFLLGNEWGMGLSRRSTPMLGSTGLGLGAPGNNAGNGPTGTQDRFDTYYPGGGYENTWWFGGGYPTNPWATFPSAFYGAQDPANNTFYNGIGGQGNDAGFYCIGDWANGSTVNFMLRKNEMALPGWMLASLAVNPTYFAAPLDITVFPRMPFLAQIPMTPDGIGDFDRRSQNIGAGIAGLRLYLQGAITAMGPIAPVDCSNAIVSN